MTQFYSSILLFISAIPAVKSRYRPTDSKLGVPKVEICIFSFSFFSGHPLFGQSSFGHTTEIVTTPTTVMPYERLTISKFNKSI